MKTLRWIHGVVGVLALLAFVLTGQYMHWVHDHLYGMADGPRMMYRTAHIYLLFAAVPNLVLAAYLTPLREPRLQFVQWAAGLALAVMPVFLCLSFFAESTLPDLIRPIARVGIYLALIGGVLHGMAAVADRMRRTSG